MNKKQQQSSSYDVDEKSFANYSKDFPKALDKYKKKYQSSSLKKYRTYNAVAFDLEAATPSLENVYIHTDIKNRYLLNQTYYKNNLTKFYQTATDVLLLKLDSAIKKYRKEEDRVLAKYATLFNVQADPEKMLKLLSEAFDNSENAGAQIIKEIESARRIMNKQFHSQDGSNITKEQAQAYFKAILGGQLTPEEEKQLFTLKLADGTVLSAKERDKLPNLKAKIDSVLSSLDTKESSIFLDEDKSIGNTSYLEAMQKLDSLIEDASKFKSVDSMIDAFNLGRMKLGVLEEPAQKIALAEMISMYSGAAISLEMVGFKSKATMEEIKKMTQEELQKVMGKNYKIGKKVYQSVQSAANVRIYKTVDLQMTYTDPETNETFKLNIDVKSNADKYATTKTEPQEKGIDIFLKELKKLDPVFSSENEYTRIFYYLLMNDTAFGMNDAINTTQFKKLAWLMYFVGVLGKQDNGATLMQEIFGAPGEAPTIITLGKNVFRFSALLQAVRDRSTVKGSPELSVQDIRSNNKHYDNIVKVLRSANEGEGTVPYSSDSFYNLYANDDFNKENKRMNNRIRKSGIIKYTINLSYSATQLTKATNKLNGTGKKK